jgi:hypothetical protein
MADYRVYVIDADGHITRPPAVVTCNTDRAAVEQARQMVGGQDFELWEGPRLVKRIKFLD